MYYKSFFRQADRRREQFGPCHAAKSLVRGPHAGHRTRNAGGPVTDTAQARNDIAIFIEIHIAAGEGWRDFPVIQKMRLTIHIDQHEAAAADIARLRIGHGERKGRGDRRIDRVSAGAQHEFGNVGPLSVRHGKRRLAGGHYGRGLNCRRAGGQQETA